MKYILLQVDMQIFVIASMVVHFILLMNFLSYSFQLYICILGKNTATYVFDGIRSSGFPKFPVLKI